MDNINTERILLECLNYPEFARVEYLSKEQVKSGWLKSSFIGFLKTGISNLRNYVVSFIKGKSPIPSQSEWVYYFEDEILKSVKNSINLNDIDLLKVAIEEYEAFGEPIKEYSDAEVIGLANTAMTFINEEFQTQLKAGLSGLRPIPKAYFERKSKGETPLIFYHYNLSIPAPLFDYNRIEEAIYNTLLNSQNIDGLKKIIEPIFIMASENIMLWNDKLSKYIYHKGGEYKDKSVYGQIYALYNHQKRDFVFYLSGKDEPRLKNLKSFTNRDFVIYSYKLYRMIKYLFDFSMHEKNEYELSETDLPKEETENDFVLSTIEDYLHQFKANMSENDYNSLVSALNTFFRTKKFPILSTTIRVVKVSVKNFGWQMKNLFHDVPEEHDFVEYLSFFKNNVSIYLKTEFSRDNYTKSTLYKYFHTKTQ